MRQAACLMPCIVKPVLSCDSLSSVCNALEICVGLARIAAFVLRSSSLTAAALLPAAETYTRVAVAWSMRSDSH
eukprot:8867070-Pyramimonas_sp.AAC.1